MRNAFWKELYLSALAVLLPATLLAAEKSEDIFELPLPGGNVITLGQIIVWVLIAMLLVSLLKKLLKGAVWFMVVGARVAGVAASWGHLDLGLGKLEVQYEDLVSALGGSSVAGVVGWFFKKRSGGEKED